MPSTKRAQSTRDRVMVTVLMAGVFIATMGGAYAAAARSVRRVETAGLSLSVPREWREVENIEISRDPLMTELRVFQAPESPLRQLWVRRLRLDELMKMLNAPAEVALREFLEEQRNSAQAATIISDEAGERHWLVQVREPSVPTARGRRAVRVQNLRLLRLIEQSARIESE